jgi:transcriptional regulator with XRE-family HTH domain
MRYSYEAFLIELGQRLKQLRKDRGLSLRDMVADHNFHFTQWQSFEKGRGISVQTLLRLCEVFDLRLDELVRDIGKFASAANGMDRETAASKIDAKPKERKTIDKSKG